MASEDEAFNMNLYPSLSNGYCTALPFIYSSTKMKKMRCSQDDISIGSYLGTFASLWSAGQCPVSFWRPTQAKFHRTVYKDGMKFEKVFILFSLGLFFGTTFSFAVKYLVVHIWCCKFTNCCVIQSEESSHGPIRTLDWKHQFICFNIG